MPRRNSTLDLRRSIGQLLIIGFDGTEVSPGLATLLNRLQPAGVILFARNITGGEQTYKLLKDCQACISTPLFTAVDMEGGRVDRFRNVFGRTPSAADVFASGIVLLGLTLASKPADSNHPYGHGRLETLTGLFIGFLLAIAGVGISSNALRLVGRTTTVPASFVIWPLLGSAAVKSLLSGVKFHFGRKIRSSALLADAWNDFNVDVRLRMFEKRGVPVGIELLIAGACNHRDRGLRAREGGQIADSRREVHRQPVGIGWRKEGIVPRCSKGNDMESIEAVNAKPV